MSIFFIFEIGSQAVILPMVTCRGRNTSTQLDSLLIAYTCLCASSGRRQELFFYELWCHLFVFSSSSHGLNETLDSTFPKYYYGRITYFVTQQHTKR